MTFDHDLTEAEADLLARIDALRAALKGVVRCVSAQGAAKLIAQQALEEDDEAARAE